MKQSHIFPSQFTAAAKKKNPHAHTHKPPRANNCFSSNPSPWDPSRLLRFFGYGKLGNAYNCAGGFEHSAFPGTVLSECVTPPPRLLSTGLDPSPLQQIRANLSSPYGHLGPGTDIIVPWKIAFLLRTAWQIGAGLKEVFGQDRGPLCPFRLSRHFLALVPEYVLYSMYHVPVMRPRPRHWRSSTHCRRREYTYRVYPTRDIPSR